jgi:hypothetical protein
MPEKSPATMIEQAIGNERYIPARAHRSTVNFDQRSLVLDSSGDHLPTLPIQMRFIH